MESINDIPFFTAVGLYFPFFVQPMHEKFRNVCVGNRTQNFRELALANIHQHVPGNIRSDNFKIVPTSTALMTRSKNEVPK